jgi:hypothetical protein
MDETALVRARGEIARFMERVQAYDRHTKANDGRDHRDHYACPERAAILRASLDLTRALAKLRGRS